MSKSSKVALCVLSFVLVLGLSGCGSAPTAGTPTAGGGAGTASPSSTGGSSSTAAPKPLNLAIGTPAKYDQGEVTVTKAGAGPKDYAGKKSFAVKVSYKNTGSEALSYNPYDWSLEDANGARSQDTAMINGKDSMSSGEIAPSGSLTGTIYFSPKTPASKIVYKPSFLSSEEDLATWSVK